MEQQTATSSTAAGTPLEQPRNNRASQTFQRRLRLLVDRVPIALLAAAALENDRHADVVAVNLYNTMVYLYNQQHYTIHTLDTFVSESSSSDTAPSQTAITLGELIPFVGWSEDDDKNDNGNDKKTNDNDDDAAMSPINDKTDKPLVPRNGCCGICFTELMDALIWPCYHIFSCYQCTRRIEDIRCPVCRLKIEKVIRVYYN